MDLSTFSTRRDFCCFLSVFLLFLHNFSLLTPYFLGSFPVIERTTKLILGKEIDTEKLEISSNPDSNNSEQEIIAAINEQGIQIGKLTSKLNIEKIVNSIRLQRDDISWSGNLDDFGNQCFEMLYNLKRPVFDPMREYSRFKDIIDKLSKYSKQYN